MSNLFDKITGISTSYTSTSITDTSKSWTTNYYVGWYVVIDSTEYEITANTSDTLTFDNSLADNADYSIEFVGRDFLTELESDCSNTTKIPSALISKKYNQVNVDLTNKIFAYLRKLITDDFDPMANILNLTIMQQSFGYFLLAKIFQDLMIDQNSFESFKGYNMYEKSYNDGIKDALSLIQIDFDEDGEADAIEKNNSVSSYTFLNR